MNSNSLFEKSASEKSIVLPRFAARKPRPQRLEQSGRDFAATRSWQQLGALSPCTQIRYFERSGIMKIAKAGLTASLAAMSMMAASSAFAYQFAVNVGGTWVTSSASATISGPTNAALGSFSVPCTATFYVSLDSGGNASVTNAVFSGSTPCTKITANNLPWALTVTGPDGASSNVTISSPSVTIPALSTTCQGSNITGTLGGNVFTFGPSFLGSCTVQSNGNLNGSPAVRVQ